MENVAGPTIHPRFECLASLSPWQSRAVLAFAEELARTYWEVRNSGKRSQETDNTESIVDSHCATSTQDCTRTHQVRLHSRTPPKSPTLERPAVGLPPALL
eukprot:2531533-Amphidinium_carterae.2